jgi:hypothetical protein
MKTFGDDRNKGKQNDKTWAERAKSLRIAMPPINNVDVESDNWTPLSAASGPFEFPPADEAFAS